MNPWSLYPHKPQLIEAGLALGLGVLTLHRDGWRPRPKAITALAVVTWGAIGFVDFGLYAFGYQLAGWSLERSAEIQAMVEWLRVPVLIVAALALVRVLPPRRSASTS